MAQGLIDQTHVSNVTIGYRQAPSTAPEPWQIRLTGFILSAIIILWSGVLSPLIDKRTETGSKWKQWATSLPPYIITTIRTVSSFIASIRAASRAPNSALLPVTGLMMLSLSSFPGALTWPTPLNFLSYANSWLAFLAAWIVFGYCNHDSKQQYGVLEFKGGNCPFVWYHEDFARNPEQLRDLCLIWAVSNATGGCSQRTSTGRYVDNKYLTFDMALMDFNWTGRDEQVALYIFMPVAITLGFYLLLAASVWVSALCAWMCKPGKFEGMKGRLGRHIWKVSVVIFVWTLIVGSFSTVAHMSDQTVPRWGGYQKAREDLNGDPALLRPTIVVDGFGADWWDCFLVNREYEDSSYTSFWWGYVKNNAAAYLAFV